jgi:hypothetical protein
MVEVVGFEPDNRLLAKQLLYRWSYTPWLRYRDLHPRLRLMGPLS